MSTPEISLLVQQLVTATKGRRRRPSQRNLDIYERVHVDGESQINVAMHCGLSQPRVSAICKQVERWHAQQEAGVLGGLPEDQRQREQRLLARRRLETVYGWSLRGLQTSGQSLTTCVQRQTDDGPIMRHSTNREQQFDPRWAKIARESALNLWELAAAPQPPAEDGRRRVAVAERIVRLVAGLRRMVRKAGSSECLPQLIQQVLQSCLERDLGEPVLPADGLPADAPPAPSAAPTALENQPAAAACSNYSSPAPETTSAVAAPAPLAASASEATAATSGDSAERAAAPEPPAAALPKTAVRTGSPTGQRSAGKSVKPADESLSDAEQQALRQLEFQFHIGMNRDSANAELRDFLSDRKRSHPRWGYSNSQQAALLEWQRLQHSRPHAPREA